MVKRLLAATLILLVAVNLLIFLGYRVSVWIETWTRSDQPGQDNVVVERHQVPLEVVYPRLTPDQIDAMLGETWSRGTVYDADAVFGEGPLDGAYVTVDAAGFRHSTDQAAWPPAADAPIVFVFGGSTTFGYGVPDDDTVASALSARLRALPGMADAQVYNFARGFFYSKLEQRLFTGLVGHGHVPDIAIFIDGLNEFANPGGNYPGAPAMAAARRAEEREAPPPLVRIDWQHLGHLVPMARLAGDVGTWLEGAQAPAGLPTPAAFDPSVYDDPAVLDRIIERYLHQQRIIRSVAAEFSVAVHFIWQPVATYAYDLDHHLFARHGRDDGTAPIFGDHNRSAYGYRRFAARRAGEGLPADMTWCADITRDLAEPLYVDAVHYSGRLAGLLADCIVDQAL